MSRVCKRARTGNVLEVLAVLHRGIQEVHPRNARRNEKNEKALLQSITSRKRWAQLGQDVGIRELSFAPESDEALNRRRPECARQTKLNASFPQGQE
jgi:hypothetical protein